MGSVLDRPTFARQGPLIVIYGPPGIGKTSLIAGLASAMHDAISKPVLHADWEASTESLVPLLEHAPDGALKVWVPDLQKSPADEAIDMIDAAIKLDASALVVDTVGAMLEHTLRWLSKQNYGSKGKSTLRPGVRTPRGLTIQSSTQQDYGMVLNALHSWLEYALRLRNRGVPIILLAHERLVASEDESGQTIDAKGGPELVGRKAVRDFPKLAQVIVHAVYNRRPGKAPSRVLKAVDDGLWIGKDRLSLWPKKGFDITGDSEKDIVERAVAFWKPVIARLMEKGLEAKENGNGNGVHKVPRRRRVNGNGGE